MGTKAVTKSLALLPLQPVKEQFPQRQTLKIARSRLHPCQPHPDEAACEQPPPLSAHGARPPAQVTQLSGPVPVGPRPRLAGGSPGGPSGGLAGEQTDADEGRRERALGKQGLVSSGSQTCSCHGGARVVRQGASTQRWR